MCFTHIEGILEALTSTFKRLFYRNVDIVRDICASPLEPVSFLFLSICGLQMDVGYP